MELIKDVVKFVFWVLVLAATTVALIATTMAPVLVFNKAACVNNSEITGLETKWKVAGNCYIKDTNGQWLPFDKWNSNEHKVKISE